MYRGKEYIIAHKPMSPSEILELLVMIYGSDGD